MTPEEILTAVCPGMELKVLETTEVSLSLLPQSGAGGGALISLGKRSWKRLPQKGRPSTLAASSVTQTTFGPEEIQNLLLEI